MIDIKFIQLGGSLILKINNSVHILNADHGFNNEVSLYFYTQIEDTSMNIQDEWQCPDEMIALL
jgi:hypothetical protein